MRVLIIYTHPYSKSLNHEILHKLVAGLKSAGHETRIKDLYAENFDPRLTEKNLAALQAGEVPKKINQEHKALSWAEGLVFIYPLWWFGPPAILKGWFDCTLTYGYAFKHQNGDLQGLLQHKKARVIITAGSKEEWFKSRNAQDIIYRPVTEGTLEFCGIKDVDYKIIYNASALSKTAHDKTLATIYTMGRLFEQTEQESQKIHNTHKETTPTV